MSSTNTLVKASKPYPPTSWSLGAPASRIPDVPIDAVFLVLFAILGITSLVIFLRNRFSGRFFIFNAIVFGMSLTRVIANAMRIASVYQPHNINMAIATQVFVAAGIVTLFVTNNFFAQRIVRALHPRFGWTKPVKIYPIAVTILVLAHICIIIVPVILTFFTLDQTIRTNDRIVQIYGSTFFAVMAFLPIPVVLTALLVPSDEKIDNFGTGSIRVKAVIVLTTSILLTLGATFRAGTLIMSPVPLTAAKPWYFSKACFYIFDFSIDWISGSILVFSRMDKRFFVHKEAKFLKTYDLDAAKAWRVQHETDEEKASIVDSTEAGKVEAIELADMGNAEAIELAEVGKAI